MYEIVHKVCGLPQWATQLVLVGTYPMEGERLRPIIRLLYQSSPS